MLIHRGSGATLSERSELRAAVEFHEATLDLMAALAIVFIVAVGYAATRPGANTFGGYINFVESPTP